MKVENENIVATKHAIYDLQEELKEA